MRPSIRTAAQLLRNVYRLRQPPRRRRHVRPQPRQRLQRPRVRARDAVPPRQLPDLDPAASGRVPVPVAPLCARLAIVVVGGGAAVRLPRRAPPLGRPRRPAAPEVGRALREGLLARLERADALGERGVEGLDVFLCFRPASAVVRFRAARSRRLESGGKKKRGEGGPTVVLLPAVVVGPERGRQVAARGRRVGPHAGVGARDERVQQRRDARAQRVRLFLSLPPRCPVAGGGRWGAGTRRRAARTRRRARGAPGARGPRPWSARFCGGGLRRRRGVEW